MTQSSVRFSEGSFQIFRRDILVYVVQIFTGAVVARVLGPEAMGLWIILQMIPSYAEPLGRIHFDSASCYFVNLGRYRIGEAAFAMVMASLVTTAVLIALFLWQWEWLFASFLEPAAGVPHYVLAMLAMIPLRFLTVNYSYLHLMQEDVVGYNRLALLSGLFPSVGGSVLLLVSPLGVAALVGTTLAGSIAAVVYGAIRIHRRDPMVPNTNVALLKDLASFGSKLYLQQLVGYFNLYVSGLLVLLYLPAAAVAFFRIGQERALLLSRVPTAAGVMLYPRVTRLSEQPQEARELTTGAFRMMFWVLLLLGATAALLAAPAVVLLYGRQYAPAVLPLIIFIPGVVADASSGLLAQHFTGRGRLWLIIGLAAASLVCQCLLLWIAIPRWGLLGAAVAGSAAYMFSAALRLKAFTAVEHVSWSALLVPRRTDFEFVKTFVVGQIQAVLRLAPSGAR